MLIVKVYVNERQIDEVHIQNITGGTGVCTYAIRKPELPDARIIHRRGDSYHGLVRDAMNIVKSANNSTEPKGGDDDRD